MTKVDLPLSGMRLLDLATGEAAALARDLALLGAEVIRVEPPGGAADRTDAPLVEGISIPFIVGNRGKTAVALDLCSKEFAALVESADVLVEAFGDDAPSGFDAAALAERFPALVVISLSDFGRIGPHSSWKGNSAVFVALAGQLSRSGIPDREPLLPPRDLAVQCALAHAQWLTIAAYYNCLATGRGDHIDFSLLDGAALALDPGYGISGSATSGVPASRLARGRPEARYQYPIIACADGYVRICVLAPRQWQAMFEWMGRPERFSSPELNKTHARFADRELIPAIAEMFASSTRAELEAEGRRFGVPIAGMLSIDEAVSSEHVSARSVFEDVEITPGRIARLPRGIYVIDDERVAPDGPPPLLATKAGWTRRTDKKRAPPFAGLRVLDLGVIVVGAETGRLFADLGAEVIKIENAAFPDGSRQSLSGEPISTGFALGHRNKLGLGLNLRDPRGRAVFLDLVAESDVVLTNFKPGTLQSLGLDYETLSARNPGIVLVDSSAYGPSGPWSRRLGYGPLVRASTGLASLWRYPDEPDGFADAMVVYPDHVAARYGAIGALSVLVRRLRTGRGGTVSIAQAEVTLNHFATIIAQRSLGLEPPTHAGPWGVYACAGDDNWCVVAVEDDEQLAALRIVVGRPDLIEASAVGDEERTLATEAALTEWIAERTAGDAACRLQSAGVPAGQMLRVSEMPNLPHYRERGLFAPSSHPLVAEPFIAEATPTRSRNLPVPGTAPAPLRGEHSREIASRVLRLPANAIEELVVAGILESPHPADVPTPIGDRK